MNLDDIKLSQVKYQLKTFTIDAGGNTFDVPISQVVSMKVEKNYDVDNYPFFYIGVNLPGWFYSMVVANYKNLHITLDLHSMSYRKDFDESMNNPSTTSECKGRFRAELADNTPIATEDQQRAYEQYDTAYKKSYTFNEYYFTEFTIQNEAAYKAKSTKKNFIITSTNMTTSIAYLCDQVGLSNILMSPLSNQKTYSEFSIPNINVVDQLKNWIVNYKLHNAGTTLFFDLNRIYILSKELKCTAWRTNEYKTVHVLSLNQYSNSLASGSGFYSNSKEKYHVIEIPPNNMQVTQVETLPSPVFTSNSKITKSLMFYTDAVRMEALTPNKLFIVDIQSPTSKNIVNGKYRITRYSAEFEPGGDFFDVKFNITLGR